MRTAFVFLIGFLAGAAVMPGLAQGDRPNGVNYVNHVAIAVDNFDEAFAFYTQKMGFREAFTVRDDKGQPTLAYVQASRNTFVELQRANANRPAGLNHFGLHVENLKATVAGLRERGVKVDDINFATSFLAGIVQKYKLPPKVLVVHRFTQNMLRNYKGIKLDPRVQIVMHMDGWGAPWLKRDSYRDYIVREPVQYTGFKLFYHNDTKKGDPLMSPADLLKLEPKPLYIQYQ